MIENLVRQDEQVQTCFRIVACHDPGAGNYLYAFGLVGNMRIMICLGQRGLRSLSALSSSIIYPLNWMLLKALPPDKSVFL